jgi:hypothetical protein
VTANDVWKLVCKYPGDWELYDVDADRTELNDLSAEQPDRVARMATTYQDWAERCRVLPWEALLALRGQESVRGEGTPSG